MPRTIVFFLVCSIAVSLPAFAATGGESSAGEPVLARSAVLPFGLSSLPQLDQKSWQEERDAAISKKNRGRALMWIGAGVTGLGALMVTKVSGDCYRSSSFSICEYDYRVPGLVLSSGAGVMVWGIMQQRDAGRTLSELERQRPTGARGGQVPIVVAGGTSLSVGDGVTLRHAVSW